MLSDDRTCFRVDTLMADRYIILRATRGGRLVSTHHRTIEAADTAWKLVARHKPIWALMQHLEWNGAIYPIADTVKYMGRMQ